MLNLRTTDDEYTEMKKFAAFQGMSVSSFILESVREKMEDWEDREAAEDFEKDFSAGRIETVSWKQVKKDAGLL
jgi:uncharacterized protein (DUF1778 family)